MTLFKIFIPGNGGIDNIVHRAVAQGKAKIEAKFQGSSSTPGGSSSTPEPQSSVPPIIPTSQVPSTAVSASTSMSLSSQAPSTPPPTTELASSTPTGTTPPPITRSTSCLTAPGAGLCYVNVTVDNTVTDTSEDQCADPRTCQCLTTDRDTVCTSSNGLCLSTPTNYTLCDPFVSCAAAPTTLGFEDLSSGAQSNPLTYAGLTFAASAAATYPASLTTFLTIVNTGTEEYPIIESGTKGFEASFSEVSDNTGFDPAFNQSLNIGDSGTNGAFVPVSAYVNGLVSNGPTKLSLRASNGGGCVADTLSFITSNAVSGSGGTPIRLSLDEFVVCKANAASGLQGVLGHG
ncbi:hypothetical protein WJX75_001050 [Coccomyxa subellipsoidea]|uniref:Uncharacterized protein n=1 Tax=Coccomyxa subellipsoidea TaxID=248742 RepID=A0ABR2YQP7_9CHLO